MNLATRLMKAKALIPEQLSQALHRQKKSRGFLANHILALGLMEQSELAKFVAPAPMVPETFADVGLPEKLLTRLFLKHAFFSYTFTLREMSETGGYQPQRSSQSLSNSLGCGNPLHPV